LNNQHAHVWKVLSHLIKTVHVATNSNKYDSHASKVHDFDSCMRHE